MRSIRLATAPFIAHRHFTVKKNVMTAKNAYVSAIGTGGIFTFVTLLVLRCTKYSATQIR